MVKIKEYIESGILELYVLGFTSEEETKELLTLKKKYSEIQEALWDLETDLENISQQMSITPPPGTFEKIEAGINSLVKSPGAEDMLIAETIINHKTVPEDRPMFEVESSSSHMRILKIWGWVFGAVFLLGAIFLACAIYFYHKSNQTEQQIERMKTRLNNERKR
ncbi:hypothetical protein [Pedobacter sp. L105]|uniref:hypothetical protein n=1 Tax=Pedobacter sp. L105 TaxID=1641871 RepID=UPI00131AC1C8|nr:hypothetical protein [Pedobacter sp. L105]